MRQQNPKPAKAGVVNIERDFANFLSEYVQTRSLLRTDYSEAQGKREAPYQEEDIFWDHVISKNMVYETQKILLKSFILSEWIPMSPGQYHTREGRAAREDALNYVKYSTTDDIVFDPYGKLRMVKGGVGCLRVSGKQIGSERLYFLGATSTGVAHQGILVGIPEELYSEKVGRYLKTQHVVLCDVIGQVRYWSPRDNLPFQSNRNLPRVYIYATDIQVHLDSKVRKDIVDVTAAVTFYGETERREGVFYVYSHFDPTDPSSLDRCIDWMEDEYVKRQYSGVVVTDFDEMVPRFEGTVFPVEILMDQEFKFDRMTVYDTLHRLRIPGHMRSDIRFIVEQLIVEGDMTNYNITGHGNVIGNNNQVINNINSKLNKVKQTIGSLPNSDDATRKELEQLVSQLAEALKEVPADQQEDAELVTELTGELVEATNQPQPKKRMLEIKGENLKKSAENLATVTPTVLTIATQIVMLIGKFASQS